MATKWLPYLVHVSVIITGFILAGIIGIWNPPSEVSCDVTERAHELMVFTYSTKSPYQFKAPASNETALGTCKTVTVRVEMM